MDGLNLSPLSSVSSTVSSTAAEPPTVWPPTEKKEPPTEEEDEEPRGRGGSDPPDRHQRDRTAAPPTLKTPPREESTEEPTKEPTEQSGSSADSNASEESSAQELRAQPAGLLAVTAAPIDEQVELFLKAFVFDFQDGKNGGFAGVLTIAEQFRGYLAEASDCDCEIDAAHRFLEARNEATTVEELRQKMQAIDIDRNRRMALIEYLLFRYGKSVGEFLNPPFEVPAHLRAALEKATAAHRAHWKEREERNLMYETLERTSVMGGVKGLRAKAELAAARARNWTADWNAREVTAAAGARSASRVVAAADKETLSRQAIEAEEARLAEEAAGRKAAEDLARKAGQAALRSRAARWEGSARAAAAVTPVTRAALVR